jgi:protein phosphatase
MDSLLLKSRNFGDKTAVLAVVCDGVGSLADGAYASGMAVKKLSEWFETASVDDRIGLIMRDAILDINAGIVREAENNNMNTASTLSALLLVESDYYVIHIGDSRVYSYDDHTLTLHTSDDVSSSGKLTAYIGKRDDIFLQYSEGQASGKTFLVCSDGLYKHMDDDFMISKLKNLNKRTLKEPVESLPQYVIDRGEQDNITLAIVKIIV